MGIWQDFHVDKLYADRHTEDQLGDPFMMVEMDGLRSEVASIGQQLATVSGINDPFVNEKTAPNAGRPTGDPPVDAVTHSKVNTSREVNALSRLEVILTHQVEIVSHVVAVAQRRNLG
jgi:hypothetical protein